MSIVNIAVCDDDSVFREMLVSGVGSYAKSSDMDISVFSFSNGLELMISEIEYNLIFLDYKMGIMNGLETAKKLRNKGINCPIIFVTGFEGDMPDVTEVHAFRFLHKPVENESLVRVLDEFVNLYKKRKTVAFVSNGETVSLYSDEIIYVEKKLLGCIVHTAGEFYRLPQSLGDFAELLPKEEFFRCHKLYYVNLKYIRGIEEGTLLLENGELLKVDKAKINALKEARGEFGKAAVFV